jgi:FkbM family methyltransferase
MWGKRMLTSASERQWALLHGGKSAKTRLVLYAAVGCLCLSTIAMDRFIMFNNREISITKLQSNGPNTTTTHFITTAKPCPSEKPSWKNLNATYFRSQTEEDRHLLEHFFHGLCGGTYVELGGLDGITISNSHIFAHVYDWKGVLIELAPSNYQKLVQNRPHELVAPIQAAVCNSERIVHYIEENGKFWGTTSGIWEFMSDSFRQTWWKHVSLADTKPIRCTPLRQLFREYTPNIHWFDFLSLDVEGAERDVLESIDFTTTAFGVILVEADRHARRKNVAVRMLLERQGYVFLEDWGRSYWFVHSSFDLVYDVHNANNNDED